MKCTECGQPYDTVFNTPYCLKCGNLKIEEFERLHLGLCLEACDDVEDLSDNEIDFLLEIT